MSDSDAALVIRSQRGDRTAFEQLVRNTGRLVYTRLYLDVPDVHRAEDLTQETFLRAWRRIAQVTDPTGFRPWLLSVAQSVAVDALRREKRKKRASGDAIPAADLEKLPDGRPQPREAAESAESRQRLLDALRQLPEDYRTVLMLRYLGGADYQAMERQLGLSNGSLRGLLHRGLAMLKERLNARTS